MLHRLTNHEALTSDQFAEVVLDALLARAEEAPERLAEFATGLLTVDRGAE